MSCGKPLWRRWWTRSRPRAPGSSATRAELPQRGQALRARRLQRGLELAEAARELGLPAKSLRALEWDRPDLLADAGELEHRYAAFLGLDGGPPAAEEAVAVPAPPRPARRSLWVPLAAVLAPAVVIAVLFVRGEVNQRTDDGESARPQGPPPGISSAVSIPETGAPPSPEAPDAAAAAPRPRTVNLVLTADRGASWVEAHAGSATGPLLFEGTLESGRELRFEASRIWLRLGAASNLSIAVNGRPAPGELHGTLDVVVTPRGIESA